ncbi:helitron_like_N domain-containing protein [Trichonephila inaurata madagascariensis]|uniref:Helitron_like_N domain-containing protein n=1 Tax=Trichonephila inaurata madagascariensis TaxID=2747483 RepID=A0A8X6YQB8_9ARAC|nr:helitron_like_N domain-containing protein [Trichonephila inaurata madagascariensis]
MSHTLQKWLFGKKENAAYSYNLSIDYKSDASCTLGPMSITWQFCSVMKFKGETPGLCCSGGKVHLPVLKDPPESLHTLLSSDFIESERLRYIHCNQKKLRVEEYIHLRDAVVSEGNVSNVGQLIILPSSFTGRPRYMNECTQDAMTYVQNYGRPVTFSLRLLAILHGLRLQMNYF